MCVEDRDVNISSAKCGWISGSRFVSLISVTPLDSMALGKEAETLLNLFLLFDNDIFALLLFIWYN